VWKITILRQKIIFFSNFRGGARRVRPPLNPPLGLGIQSDLFLTNGPPISSSSSSSFDFLIYIYKHTERERVRERERDGAKTNRQTSGKSVALLQSKERFGISRILTSGTTTMHNKAHRWANQKCMFGLNYNWGFATINMFSHSLVVVT
jgi:hypothetical protein